jgi:hypothetical protein
MTHTMRFSCCEDIQWAKDSDRIVVISLDQNTSYALEGIEAMVWEYLTLGYTDPQLTTQLSALLDTSPACAHTTVTEILVAWERKGLIKQAKVI